MNEEEVEEGEEIEREREKIRSINIEQSACSIVPFLGRDTLAPTPLSEMAFSYKFVLALVALIAVQANCGMVRRSSDTANPLQELMDAAKVQLQKVTEEWNKVTGTNFEELKTVLESKTKELEAKAKNVMEELKRQYETHAPELSAKANEALQEAQNRLNLTLEHMKAQAPGAMEEANALQQRFTDAFKATVETMFEESGKVAKAAGEDASSVHTALTNLSRTALTQTMEVMQQFHNEVQKVVTHATS